MPDKFMEELEKRIRVKLSPPTVRTPLASAIEKIKDIARKKKLLTLRS